MFRKSVSAIILTMLAAPVFAGDYVIHVHGIVCSFCSQGVSKKVSRLAFIDQSKYTKGVKVEIESQRVTVAVNAGEKIDIAALFNAIKSGGYEPVDVWTVNESGELETRVDVEP